MFASSSRVHYLSAKKEDATVTKQLFAVFFFFFGSHRLTIVFPSTFTIFSGAGGRTVGLIFKEPLHPGAVFSMVV